MPRIFTLRSISGATCMASTMNGVLMTGNRGINYRSHEGPGVVFTQNHFGLLDDRRFNPDESGESPDKFLTVEK